MSSTYIIKTKQNNIPILGLLVDFFRSSIAYREYLKQSVARDLRKRYKRSVLGYFWSMLNPLFMMIILSVVFSNLMKSHIPAYPVFLFAGLLPFTYFSATITTSLDSIAGNMNLIKQVPVPKYIFPLAIACSNLMDMALTLLPLFLVMLVMQVAFTWKILLLPVIIFPIFCFTMGLSLIFSAANVFFKDTQHLTDVLMRALHFLCPVLYGRDQLPHWLVKWLALNPLFIMIEHLRLIIYYGQLPNRFEFLLSTIAGLITLAAGLWIFKKADEKFIYFV